MGVGNIIGRSLRVDVHSIKEKNCENGLFATERGHFSCICVEVVLDQPLLPKVRVRKLWYKVEYGGLPLICFGCGRFGHHRDTCPLRIRPSHKEVQESAANPFTRLSSREAERGDSEDLFGPWMIAQRSSRRGRGGKTTNMGTTTGQVPGS